MPLDIKTARDFIILALKEAGILGVGQTPLAEDVNDCFVLLQRMTSQWQKRRWMVPGLTDIVQVGNNAISNTIGPGGYWNVPRPDKIQAGYFIQLGTGITPISFPLDIFYAYEDYATKVTVKTLNSFPQLVFYDANNNAGLGNIFIWPIPSNIYEIHLIVKSQLAWPANINSAFTLPDEYAEAVHYNLALRICSTYQVDPKVITAKLAKVSLNTIKVTNTQVTEATMPRGLQSANVAFSLFNPDTR